MRGSKYYLHCMTDSFSETVTIVEAKERKQNKIKIYKMFWRLNAKRGDDKKIRRKAKKKSYKMTNIFSGYYGTAMEGLFFYYFTVFYVLKHLFISF